MSLVLIMVRETGCIGLIVITLMWPRYLTYLLWIGGVLDGLKIMTSLKKVLRLWLIACTSFVVNGLLYFVVLSGAVRGLMGVVSLSFYVYYLMVSRVWMLIVGFYVINLTVNVNFKFIVLGVLPVPLFFLKVGGMFSLYRVITLSALVFMR